MKLIFIATALFFIVNYASTSCPDGTLQSLNNPLICYQFNTEPTVFTEAEFACQSKAGHLAAVTDGFTNTFLAQNANKTFTSGPDFWVGGEDLDHKGKWVWTDGSAFVFTNWAPNEPDLLPGYQCISVTMDRSFWYTTDCFDEKPFVCELPALVLPTSSTKFSTGASTGATNILPTTSISPVEDTTTTGTAARDATTTTAEAEPPTTTLGPPIYTCDGGWSQFNETECFKTFTKNVFDDAEVACKSFGGHLASIHSEEEMKFVNALLDNYYYWLGVCTTDNGLTWVSNDGTSVDFINDNWCSTGPQHTSGTCVVITPTLNCFTNVRKSLVTSGLCKKPANVSYGTL